VCDGGIRGFLVGIGLEGKRNPSFKKSQLVTSSMINMM
jgi:hypothetical protein